VNCRKKKCGHSNQVSVETEDNAVCNFVLCFWLLCADVCFLPFFLFIAVEAKEEDQVNFG